MAKIGRTFYILEIFTQVDGITFKLFVHYSNYSNSWVRIALFGIRIRSFFRNRIYSVFSIRCIFKNRIYSVFDIRSNFTIRDNTVNNRTRGRFLKESWIHHESLKILWLQRNRFYNRITFLNFLFCMYRTCLLCHFKDREKDLSYVR